MKFFKIILLATIITSCAPIRVSYDFDKNTNFTKYKSYNYFSDMETGLSDLDVKRLLNAIDLNMKAKGLDLSEAPDFFIDIKSSAYQEAPRNTVGVGLGGTGRHVGGGISIGVPVGQGNLNRRIIIDFVDKSGMTLFWQAVSEASFNPNATPEERENRLKAIVEKVLGQYPPKQ
ncbi:DUF4136 domain-containing protein [Snuella sedimenti]|uniref:DUF4136 domain-containing protein n=1 Tax=Snuella sedimenti TaxID=2798802 RepID=A0A8J7IUF0_9FLAO|nr:DUF4136 domain-containing protein [Snuella sedimenti]MBJ6366835.1 DUF4136 domain-containing protein [Snuella sedimenti]